VESEDRALVIGHEVSVGEDLIFCRRDPRSAARDLDRMLGEIARSLPGPVRAGIYVSCLARGPNLFEQPAFSSPTARSRAAVCTATPAS
jgi:small ligand-binding sensory domain FIST